jgi:hypothetical protein
MGDEEKGKLHRIFVRCLSKRSVILGSGTALKRRSLKYICMPWENMGNGVLKWFQGYTRKIWRQV